ncbi:MAG: 1,4-dihydroxy-2-naphthoate polyprenyltransferase [Rhodoluna sp.]
MASKKSTPKAATKATPKRKVSPVKLWVEGARLRTLPLAIAPVLIGWGAAGSIQSFKLPLALLALAVALFLQIGVNYANDYSDGIRGTDEFRVGPLRLTGSKSVRPELVKYVAFAFFGLAALAGLAIVVVTGFWWLLAVGAAAIVAAWFYTGGKNPYGYAGLGELAVFLFFGLVATVGTAFIQIGSFDANSLFGGAAIGLFAAAVLMINNIRDIDQDVKAGKRTLAVKVGKKWAKAYYLVMIWLPFLILLPFPFLYPATFFAWLAVLLVLPATLVSVMAKTPRELILVLKLTSFAALVFGVFFGYGLAVVNFAL